MDVCSPTAVRNRSCLTQVIARLRELVVGIWKEAKVEMYGSCFTGESRVEVPLAAFTALKPDDRMTHSVAVATVSRE